MIKPALYPIISQVSHFSSTSESLSGYLKFLSYRIQTCFFLSLWELVLLLSSRFIATPLSSAQLFLTLFSNSWLLILTFLLPTTPCSLNSIVLALSAYLFCDNVVCFFFLIKKSNSILNHFKEEDHDFWKEFKISLGFSHSLFTMMRLCVVGFQYHRCVLPPAYLRT